MFVFFKQCVVGCYGMLFGVDAKDVQNDLCNSFLLYPYHINDKILFSTIPWIFNKVYFATVNILGTPVIDV